MEESVEEYRRPEPGAFVYGLAAVLGALTAFAVESLWLEPSSPWMALAIGAALALLGVLSMENIGDTIVFCVILGLVVTGFVVLVPGLPWLDAALVSGAIGLCAGKLVVGVWTELEP